MYIYLILNGSILKNQKEKCLSWTNSILYVSELLACSRPAYNGNIQSKTIKQEPLANPTYFLLGSRLFINTSIAIILLRLSGDVESNPGPMFEIPGLKVSHLNVRSSLPKIDLVRMFISKNPFDVFTSSETWLKPTVTNAEINIPNYLITRQDRKDKAGGGTAIYIKEGLPYRTRDDLCSGSIETCWIEIIRPLTKSMFVCSAYGPPEFPLKDFIGELNKDLGKIPENAEIVLLGDLNVDYNQCTTDKSCMQTLVRAHSIEQIITTPTRITEKNAIND